MSDICFFTVSFRTSSDRDAKGMKGSSKEKEGGGGFAYRVESSASVYSHGNAGFCEVGAVITGQRANKVFPNKLLG